MCSNRHEQQWINLGSKLIIDVDYYFVKYVYLPMSMFLKSFVIFYLHLLNFGY